nr:MAG TPA: hypothetical protein [Caudoviricetes sp.]
MILALLYFGASIVLLNYRFTLILCCKYTFKDNFGKIKKKKNYH